MSEMHRSTPPGHRTGNPRDARVASGTTWVVWGVLGAFVGIGLLGCLALVWLFSWLSANNQGNTGVTGASPPAQPPGVWGLPEPEQQRRAPAPSEVPLPPRDPVVEKLRAEEREKKRAEIALGEAEALAQFARSQDGVSQPGLCFGVLDEGQVQGAVCTAISPNGRVLVSSKGPALFIWNLRTGSVLRRLDGHSSQIHAIQFLPDGKEFISASEDQTLLRWDVETGELKRKFTGHTLPIRGVHISPDGKLMISTAMFAGRHDLPKVWKLDEGVEWKQFHDTYFTLGRGAFRPDGKTVLAPGTRTSSLFRDIETGRSYHSKVPPGHILAMSPDGWSLAIQKASGELQLFDIATGAACPLEGHANLVLDAVFSPDGKLLASSDTDTLILWDVATGKLRSKIQDPSLFRPVFSPGGLWLTTNMLRVWLVQDLLSEPLCTSASKLAKYGSFERRGMGRGFRFHNSKVQDSDLLPLKDVPGLTSLTLRGLENVTGHWLSELRNFQELRRLDLSGMEKLDDAGLAELRRVPNLDTLIVDSHVQITDKGVEHLRDFPKLTELNLEGIRLTRKGLSVLKAMSNLRKLRVQWDRNSDSDLRLLGSMTQLETLEISGGHFEDAHLRHLASMKNLRRLDLSHMHKLNGGGLSHLTGLKELRQLRLSGDKFTPKGLAALKNLTKLESLDIANADLGNDGLASLSSLQLTELRLGKTGVTDLGLVHLAQMTSLKFLKLPPNTTDEGLSCLVGLRNLHYLDVSGTAIGAGGVEVLAELKNLQFLRYGQSKIMDKDLDRLRRARPGIRIVR